MKKIDSSSETWDFLKEWAQNRLVEHREYLEALTIRDEEAAVLRGRIDELKELVGLPNKKF